MTAVYKTIYDLTWSKGQ